MSKVMTKADENKWPSFMKSCVFFGIVLEPISIKCLFHTDGSYLVCHQSPKARNCLTNPMHWEIKKIYAKEYAVSVQAVELIRKELYPDFHKKKLRLSLCISSMRKLKKSANQSAYEHTELTNNILRIVKYSMNIEFDENSSYFQRFVTHIRYYLIRQSQEKEEPVLANPMIALAFSSYPKKRNADSIKEYLFEQKGWHVNDMELMYLILHIGNLAAHSKLT